MIKSSFIAGWITGLIVAGLIFIMKDGCTPKCKCRPTAIFMGGAHVLQSYTIMAQANDTLWLYPFNNTK